MPNESRQTNATVAKPRVFRLESFCDCAWSGSSDRARSPFGLETLTIPSERIVRRLELAAGVLYLNSCFVRRPALASDEPTIECIESQPFAENTYVAHLAGRSDCVIVDPGMEPD